jgi:hypothetical protein
MPLRWILAASLIAGPAFASFRCPARGGAPWREYRSAHFVIDTDAGARDAQSLVREFEHMRALLLQALVGERVPGPLGREHRRYAGRGGGAAGQVRRGLQLEKRAVATAPGEGMRKRQAEIEQRCSAPR